MTHRSVRFPLFGLTAVALLVAASGCTHTQVHSVQESAPPASSALGYGGVPPSIYVADFATRQTQVQLDPGGPIKRLTSGQPLMPRQNNGLFSGLFNPRGDQGYSPKNTAGVSDLEMTATGDMQHDLIAELGQRGITAFSTAGYRPDLAANALLLSGQFKTIDEGSKTRRIMIGLGAGASFLSTSIQLRNLTQPDGDPLLTFDTATNSGSAPGVAVSGGIGAATGAATAAVGAGVSGARAADTGPSTDIAHAAEEIADYIKSYYQKQGWLPADKAMAPATSAAH